jgi:hypothetical protein
MKLAVVPLEHWEELNQSLHELLAVLPNNTLRTYRGLAHAAYEIVQGAAQFFSHKRHIGMVKGQTPYFEPLMASFYKDAFGMQVIPYENLRNSEAIKAWVEALSKDTSFVLFAEDHPVTGELFPWEELDQLLNEKRIFAFRISHFQHFHRAPLVKPYSVQLCYLDPDLAVAKCGERFKVPPLLAPAMDWDVPRILQQIQRLHRGHEEPQQVELFESQFLDLATPWFSPGAARLYDRVVLNFKDVSGEALLRGLQQTLQLDSSQLFQTIDTTNLCRWNHYRTFSSWWLPQPSEADLQGLLVIDSGWLVTKDFAKILRQICEEIKAEQSW